MLGIGMKMRKPGGLTLQARVLAIFRRPGVEAHVYQFGGSQVTYGPDIVNWLGLATSSGITVDAQNKTITFDGSQSDWDLVGVTQQAVASGKSYRLDYTISRNAGSVKVSVGPEGYDSASGTYSKEQLCNGAFLVQSYNAPNKFAGTISNFTVREVITSTATANGLPVGNYKSANGSDGFAQVDGNDGLILDGLSQVGANSASGALSSFTGWSADGGFNVTGGALTVNTAGFAAAFPPIAAVPNTFYKVCVRIEGHTSGSIRVVTGDSAGPTLSANGDYTYYVSSLTTAALAYIQSQSGGFVGSISLLEISPVTGIHAYSPQPPVLRRGLLNLAYPSDPSHADWGMVNATPVSGGIQEDATEATHRTQRNVQIPAGSSITMRVKLKSTNRNAQLELAGGTGGADVAFSLSGSGAISVAAYTYGSGWTVNATSIELDTTDGYFVCLLSVTPNAGVTSVTSYIFMASGTSVVYTGDGVSTLLTKELGVFAGTLSAQQILEQGGVPVTTTVAASNPNAGLYFGEFNGTALHFAFSSVPFQINDDHAVIASARCDDAGLAAVIAQAAGKNTGPRAAELVFNAGGTLSAVWMDDSGLTKSITTAASLLGEVVVASAVKIGNDKRLRVNGEQVGDVNVDAMGMSTYDAGRIGSATWHNNFMNGAIGTVIVVKGAVTNAELLDIERLVALSTPGAPRF